MFLKYLYIVVCMCAESSLENVSLMIISKSCVFRAEISTRQKDKIWPLLEVTLSGVYLKVQYICGVVWGHVFLFMLFLCVL